MQASILVLNHRIPRFLFRIHDFYLILLSISDRIERSARFPIKNSNDQCGMVYHPYISLLISRFGIGRTDCTFKISCGTNGVVSVPPLHSPRLFKIRMRQRTNELQLRVIPAHIQYNLCCPDVSSLGHAGNKRGIPSGNGSIDRSRQRPLDCLFILF